MKHFGRFFLLLASFSLFVHPIHATELSASYNNSASNPLQEKHWSLPKTYDEILQLIDDLESGALESNYSLSSLEKINTYLATLAQEGTLPEETDMEVALNEDIHELLFGEDSALYLAHAIEESYEYSFIPAIATNFEEIDLLYCGGISRSWKKTKKFVCNHKKEIIIGAAIIAGGSVAAIIIFGGTSATTVAAGALAAGSSLGNIPSEPQPTKRVHESPSLAFFNDDTPIKSTFDQNAYTLKKSLHEDSSTASTWNERSFREKVREAGGNFAHQTFDEIMDLTKAVPQFCEEIKELGTKFMPDGPSITDSKLSGTPVDNFESLVAKGHQSIDKAFSTDQAYQFTPEAKANDTSYNFDIGLLPPPGVVFKPLRDISRYSKAGGVLDRAGFTKAGRHLMKHGYREGSVFPKPVGTPKQINAQGQQILESILNDPKRVIYERPHADFGKVLEIVVPDRWGARFSMEGEMIGFLEP